MSSADVAEPSDASDAGGPPPRLPCTGKPFGRPAIIANTSTTGAVDNGPRLSPDELVLYFHSSRDGQFLIYESVRATTTLPFGEPRALPLGSGAYYPSPSADGLRLVFDRPTPDGGEEIFIATRATSSVDFANAARVASLGSKEYDGFPIFGPNGSVWFASSRPGGAGALDLYVGTPNGAEYSVTRIAELASAVDDILPVPSSDGREIFFARSVNDVYKLFVATRDEPTDAFGAPTPAVGFDTLTAGHLPGWLSSDGCRLYLASDTTGATDLYVATR